MDAAYEFRVLVLARGAQPSPEFPTEPDLPGVSYAERTEAALAVGRAVFARGGQVIMPGDRTFSPVLAALALDYTAPAATERRAAAPAPLVVAQTEEPDETLLSLVAPYALRGAVRPIGANGEPISVGATWHEHEIDPTPGPRQPLTAPLVEAVRPAGAVFIGVDEGADGEASLLEETGVPVAVLAWRGERGESGWSSRAVTEEILADRRPRWADRESPIERRPAPMPYAYVAQRLVERWRS